MALLTGSAFADPAIDLALFKKDPGDARAYACFTRHYDAAHLKAHPKQNVTNMSMLVDSTYEYQEDQSLDPRTYSATVGVNFRNVKKPFTTSGSCFKSEDGGLLHCGIDCDGGSINVRLKDASSILVDIPDGARIYDPSQPIDAEPDAGVVPEAYFAEDDKTFLLARTSMSACKELLSGADQALIDDCTK
jgi:hypothetical protein